MFGLYLTKPFDSVSLNVRVNTAVVSVAEKNEICVAPPFFVDTVWIITRSSWLRGLDVGKFTDVEIVGLYHLMCASRKRADVPGFRKEGPNCGTRGRLPGHETSGPCFRISRVRYHHTRSVTQEPTLPASWPKGPAGVELRRGGHARAGRVRPPGPAQPWSHAVAAAPFAPARATSLDCLVRHLR